MNFRFIRNSKQRPLVKNKHPTDVRNYIQKSIDSKHIKRAEDTFQFSMPDWAEFHRVC